MDRLEAIRNFPEKERQKQEQLRRLEEEKAEIIINNAKTLLPRVDLLIKTINACEETIVGDKPLKEYIFSNVHNYPLTYGFKKLRNVAFRLLFDSKAKTHCVGISAIRNYPVQANVYAPIPHSNTYESHDLRTDGVNFTSVEGKDLNLVMYKESYLYASDDFTYIKDPPIEDYQAFTIAFDAFEHDIYDKIDKFIEYEGR